jgi:hypothetical protein
MPRITRRTPGELAHAGHAPREQFVGDGA